MRHFLESTKGAQKRGMYKGCPRGDWISGREEAQQPSSSVSKTLTSHRGGNFVCQTETEKRKEPTSLQSVCCHQEKWRRVRSHTDKKDVTARWDVETRFFSPVCAAPFQQAAATASLLLGSWGQYLGGTCATAEEHLPSCFHFLSPFSVCRNCSLRQEMMSCFSVGAQQQTTEIFH